MFKYIPELFNSAKINIDECSSKLEAADSSLENIKSKAKFAGFSRNDLVYSMEEYLLNAEKKMEELLNIEAAVRKALNIEEPTLSGNGMKGFSTSSINSRQFNVDDLLEIVNEIKTNNPYGVGQTRIDNLTKKYGADVARLVQEVIDNNYVVPQSIIDYLNSDSNKNKLYTGYVDANFSSIEQCTSDLVDLAKNVLSSKTPTAAYNEIEANYGSEARKLVEYIINNNLINGNIEVNDDLYLKVLNSNYLADMLKENQAPIPEEIEPIPEEIEPIPGKESNLNKNNNENSKTTNNSGYINLSKVSTGYYNPTTENNILYAYNKMTKEFGYTDAAAKALIANMVNENDTLDPTRTNERGAVGLFQWFDPTRKNNLQNYCKENGLDPNSTDGQLEFMNYEMKNNYNNMANGQDYGKLYDQLTGEVERGYTDITQNVTVYYEGPTYDSSENNQIGLKRANSEKATEAINLIDANRTVDDNIASSI